MECMFLKIVIIFNPWWYLNSIGFKMELFFSVSEEINSQWKMNAYVFDIFMSHSIVLEDTEEDGIFTTTCDLVEIGPLTFQNWTI